MIDLTKINADQANKIECALLQLHSDVRSFIKAHEQLANDVSLTVGTRATMRSNCEWWKAVYELIYEEPYVGEK